LENQQKLPPPQLHFLTPIYTNSTVCRLGLRPTPTGGAYSAPPYSLAVFRGLLLKGGERKSKRKGEEEGSSSFALGRKKKSRRI